MGAFPSSARRASICPLAQSVCIKSFKNFSGRSLTQYDSWKYVFDKAFSSGFCSSLSCTIPPNGIPSWGGSFTHWVWAARTGAGAFANGSPRLDGDLGGLPVAIVVARWRPGTDVSFRVRRLALLSARNFSMLGAHFKGAATRLGGALGNVLGPLGAF